MDTLKRTREIDQISTTKNASPHCPVQEKIQEKKRRKQNIDEEPKKKTKTTRKDKEQQRNSENEKEERSTSNTDCDQDSDVSFSEDIDEEIDNMETEEEDWIEYIKRSAREAREQMKKANIPCWIESHRMMKWRMAMRIASLPEERWSRKAAEWNPGLDSCIKTNRPVERPRNVNTTPKMP